MLCWNNMVYNIILKCGFKYILCCLSIILNIITFIGFVLISGIVVSIELVINGVIKYGGYITFCLIGVMVHIWWYITTIWVIKHNNKQNSNKSNSSQKNVNIIDKLIAVIESPKGLCVVCCLNLLCVLCYCTSAIDCKCTYV